jgi:hypothetical protein
MTALAVATWLLRALALYAGCGLLFAVPFLARGAARIDPGAREGTWGFRLIVLPGVVALWPLLARRWLAGATAPPEESNAHRRATRAVERSGR